MVTTAGGFLDTERIAGELGIAEGMHVGDFGCGSGYFTVSAARRVGAEGRVYAVDVQTGPLEAVVARGQQFGLENIVPVRADLEVPGSTNIPADALDIVLLANVLFQSQKKDAIIAEAYRTLKSGGRLLVVDWKKGAAGAVPDELRSEPEGMKKLVTGQGLTFERDVSAGPFYFGQLYRK